MGPQGSQGQKGNQGVQGPKGDVGAGLHDYNIVQMTVTGDGTERFVDVPCPAGHKVLGGGYAASRDDIFVPLNLPLADGNGWRVKAVGPDTTWEIQAYAVCAAP